MASIYTNIGKLVKKVTGIKDMSVFRKDVHKKVGMIIYHQKYTVRNLVNIMVEMGMKRGSVICIHASMKEFYNFKGTAEELINEILEIIGEEGSLIMPSFPKKEYFLNKNYVFNPKTDKTGAGYLAETFRKRPDVIRSINVRHSVCAWGKHAKWLTQDHHRCHDCWDKDSPWQRMMQLNVIVFNLGMPYTYIGTFHHCVESVLQYEHPYWAQFFNTTVEYFYYNEDGMIQSYYEFESNLDRRTKEKKLFRYFDNRDWKIRKISNLEIKAFYTESCFPKMLELGRRGISVYYIPSTKKYKFPN